MLSAVFERHRVCRGAWVCTKISLFKSIFMVDLFIENNQNLPWANTHSCMLFLMLCFILFFFLFFCLICCLSQLKSVLEYMIIVICLVLTHVCASVKHWLYDDDGKPYYTQKLYSATHNDTREKLHDTAEYRSVMNRLSIIYIWNAQICK